MQDFDRRSLAGLDGTADVTTPFCCGVCSGEMDSVECKMRFLKIRKKHQEIRIQTKFLFKLKKECQ